MESIFERLGEGQTGTAAQATVEDAGYSSLEIAAESESEKAE